MPWRIKTLLWISQKFSFDELVCKVASWVYENLTLAYLISHDSAEHQSDPVAKDSKYCQNFRRIKVKKLLHFEIYWGWSRNLT